MSYIVIVDMRESNGQVVAIQDGQEAIAQFASADEVHALMSQHILGQFPYLVIDLDQNPQDSQAVIS